jgi:hypothetical protein
MIKGKLFSEIFQEFQEAKTKQERINILRKYDHPSFRKFLFYIFSPDIEFDVMIPKYRPAPEPAGLNYSYLVLEIDKLYRFIRNDPKRPEGLTSEKQRQLLLVILESLHKDEAELLVQVITNKFQIPFLTKGLITEAFK